MSGTQIINNTWVCYSHNIQRMIKMSNQNITQSGTQARGLGVMISRYSPDNQLGGPVRHPVSVGFSFFKYTNDDRSNDTNQRRQHETWTW